MTDPIRVALLGSTGSIGRQAVDVIAAHPGRFEVVALVAGRDRDAVNAQAEAFGVTHERVGLGAGAAAEMATIGDADVVLNAVVGAAGLQASVAALEAGKILALANKESLVAGGEVCRAAAARGGGRIVPVDSEHSAIAQCLHGVSTDSVERIILTASGGPFRTRTDLRDVTVPDALAHPTWSMGPKITVDSATLMNKGLEVIEARFLFDMGYDRIHVVVHPQSIVHGIVELTDGSMLMQAAPTDMRGPILAALAWPARVATRTDRVDLVSLGGLDFEAVDRVRFPAVDLAYEAGRGGDSYPAALNAANERAVEAFLEERLGFLAIPEVIERVLSRHDPIPVDTLDAVLEVDAWARSEAEGIIAGKAAVSTGAAPSPIATKSAP